MWAGGYCAGGTDLSLSNLQVKVVVSDVFGLRVVDGAPVDHYFPPTSHESW